MSRLLDALGTATSLDQVAKKGDVTPLGRAESPAEPPEGSPVASPPGTPEGSPAAPPAGPPAGPPVEPPLRPPAGPAKARPAHRRVGGAIDRPAGAPRDDGAAPPTDVSWLSPQRVTFVKLNLDISAAYRARFDRALKDLPRGAGRRIVERGIELALAELNDLRGTDY